MSRLFSLAAGAALAAVAVTFWLPGLVGAQVKSADSAILQELSLYAGSKSCIECHGKFYQLWAASRHGLAMQPYTPKFARTNDTPD
jgi:mono/diheme cytochrome c family protein